MKHTDVNLCSAVAWALVAAVALASAPCGASAADDTWSTPEAKPGGKIVIRAVMVEDEDEQPAAAGKAAAEALKKAMGDAPVKLVIVSECFEDCEF